MSTPKSSSREASNARERDIWNGAGGGPGPFDKWAARVMAAVSFVAFPAAASWAYAVDRQVTLNTQAIRHSIERDSREQGWLREAIQRIEQAQKETLARVRALEQRNR